MSTGEPPDPKNSASSREQRLAKEVGQAGGSIIVTNSELADRLGWEQLPLGQVAVQAVVAGQLRKVGLHLERLGEDQVRVSGDRMMRWLPASAPAPQPASPSPSTTPKPRRRVTPGVPEVHPTPARPAAAASQQPRPAQSAAFGSVKGSPDSKGPAAAATEPKREDGGTAAEVGDLVHLIVGLLLAFAPPGVQSLFPDGIADSKGLTIFQVFVLTAPWTIAVTVIAAAAFAHKIPKGYGGPVFVVLVLLGSSFLGVTIAPGIQNLGGFMTENGFTTHGPVAFLFGLGGWVVLNYALLYGFALWLAGAVVGTYFAWLITEKTSLLE